MDDKDDIELLVDIQKDIENNNLSPVILDIVMKVMKSSEANDKQLIAYMSAMINSLLSVMVDKGLFDKADLDKFVEAYENYTNDENGEPD